MAAAAAEKRHCVNNWDLNLEDSSSNSKRQPEFSTEIVINDCSKNHHHQWVSLYAAAATAHGGYEIKINKFS